MNKSYMILCIGELLIDFICTDINSSLKDGISFQKKAGGAPANVAAAICKLGGRAAFVGKVGEDPFGRFLKSTLESYSVDTSMLIFDKNLPTTMAFVSLKSDGERDFVFSRGADEALLLSDIDRDAFNNANIVHFGSATALLGGELRKTYLKTMKTAKEKNIFVSFDPNYREDLWKGKIENFKQEACYCISYADFVKVSKEELELLSGASNLYEGAKLLHSLGAGIIAVTLGSEGTFISCDGCAATIRSINVDSIDSTGAGDAFVGAVLFRISQLEAPRLVKEDFVHLEEIVSFSNRVGALVCTKLGAMAALPSMEEIVKLL